MTDTLDLRPPQRSIRGMIGVPSTLTVSALDSEGEPKEATSVDLYIGGPISASWPLPDPLGDVVKITGTTTDPASGEWTLALPGLAAGSVLLRLVVDGVLVARLLDHVGSEGSVSPTSELTIRDGAGLVVHLTAIGGGTGDGTDEVARQAAEAAQDDATAALSGLTGKADLVDGKVPAEQLPPLGSTVTAGDGIDIDDTEVAVDATVVRTDDARLADARTPTAHTQAISTITGLETALDGKADASALGSAATADVGDFASASQGSLAASAVQPADLADVATSGSYDDLDDTPTLGTAAAQASTAFATAAQGEAAELATPALGGALRPKLAGLTSWWAALESARTTPVDVVVIGDSLGDIGNLTTPPWPQRFGRHLAAVAGHGEPPTGVTPSGGTVPSGSVGGSANTSTPSGWGRNLTSGQTITHAARCDAASVVYQRGGGTMTVTIDGGTPTSINTSGSGPAIWTSGALTYGPHTIVVGCTSGTVAPAIIQPHRGNATTGVRVWNLCHNGWASTHFTSDTTRALDFVAAIEPALVLVATGTNDTSAAAVGDLVEAVQAASPASAVVSIIPPRSDGITVSEVDAIRAEVTPLVPVVDMDQTVRSYWRTLTIDGVHPGPIGIEVMGGIVARALVGDPYGMDARAALDGAAAWKVDVLGFAAPEIRLLASHAAESLGLSAKPTIAFDSTGALRLVADSANQLTVEGKLRVDTPGDGYFLFDEVANQSQLKIFATQAAATPSLTFGTIFSIPFVQFGTTTALTGTTNGTVLIGESAGAANGTLATGRVRLNAYANVAAVPSPHVVGDLALIAAKVQVCTTAGSPGTWTIVGTQTA